MLVRFLASAAALAVATWLVPGITVEKPDLTSEVITILIVAAIFGVVNTIVKPVIKFFSIPAIFLTLGLFLLVINAMMLLVTSSLSRSLGLGFTVRGFVPALLGAVVVSITSLVLGQFVDEQSKD